MLLGVVPDNNRRLWWSLRACARQENDFGSKDSGSEVELLPGKRYGEGLSKLGVLSDGREGDCGGSKDLCLERDCMVVLRKEADS